MLAALTALLHLPSFLRAVWNPDEGFLAVQARLLAHGGVVYQTVVDRKPPLLPWLYEGLFAVFGDTSLWPQRAAALAAHLSTALLTAAVARRRWGDRTGAAAGLGVALLSVALAPEDTQAATFEVFMLPWTVAALWCADRARFGWAGAALAAAALTKQTGAAALAPVAWLAWRASGTAALGR
ncbi:glycosyltransferase family 39 protein, partial [Streptomyces sp. DvalAA-14]|uniref:glycosyltransferase family 39 protein n=1 Tax=Streptomyces sp. SID4948 TaxID=2690287 RepID=UPI002109F60C